jgi:UDP-N-acetylmuramate dehydrogenase
MMTATINLPSLRQRFGEHLQENVVLANYTTARAGGPADALLPVNSAAELEKAVQALWELDTPFIILGSGSNILVSDKGLRGVALLNRTRNVKIDGHHEPPTVWAESGANLVHLTRQVSLRGYTGMEWAGSIPGTVGGAAYGNAGAYGSDMAQSMLLVDILHRINGKETWSVEQMDYTYRCSKLKREHIPAVILGTRMRLGHSTQAEVQAKMAEYNAQRRRTQPPGASMGSMFKNPPGDYAGRLIEAAGLKGQRIGNVEISAVHANFFINLGKARAGDIFQLIQLAQQKVAEQFGIVLELEIELVGEWEVRH